MRRSNGTDFEIEEAQRIQIEPKIRWTADRRAAEELARRLGGRVIFVRTSLFEGMTTKDLPERVWLISTSTPLPALAVLGHEIYHTIAGEARANGELEAAQRQFDRVIRLLPDELKEKNFRKMGRLYASLGQQDRAQLTEEFHANLLGQVIIEPAFWQTLQRESRDLFDRVIQAVKAVLKRIGLDIPERYRPLDETVSPTQMAFLSKTAARMVAQLGRTPPKKPFGGSLKEVRPLPVSYQRRGPAATAAALAHEGDPESDVADAWYFEIPPEMRADIVQEGQRKYQTRGTDKDRLQRQFNELDRLSRRGGLSAEQQAELDSQMTEIARQIARLEQQAARAEPAGEKAAEPRQPRPARDLQAEQAAFEAEHAEYAEMIAKAKKSQKDEKTFRKHQGGFLKKLIRGILGVVEPGRLVEQNLGPEVYAAVVSFVGRPAAGAVQWDQNRIAALGDMTFGELHEEMERLTDRERADIYLTIGKPFSDEGRRAQQAAFGRLKGRPAALAAAMRQVYDANYAVLQHLGFDVQYFENYFYGSYKRDRNSRKFLGKFYRTTKNFTKEKKIPSPADALAFGLKLKDPNPMGNARRELMAIWRRYSLQRLVEELQQVAWDTGVVNETEASPWQKDHWETIDDPVTRGLYFHPDLHRQIMNMIEMNKTSSGGLRLFREITHTLNGIKFLVPMFHLRTIIAQQIVDGGIGGFLKPWRWQLGKRFQKNDPEFATPAYQEYVRLGGGHHTTMESMARRALDNFLDPRGKPWWWKHNPARAGFRATTFLQRRLNNFVFEHYIPAVKYFKYKTEVENLRRKQRREPSDNQKIKIIKEGQNFYGEMNEQIFGRSRTITSAMRFIWLAPGFREGNYRTMYKALSVAWDKQGGPNGRAWRSLMNIPQYLFFTWLLSTIGTLILTGRTPEEPEDEKDLRDQMKIKTGRRDYKGREVMIDLMTSDKDYWEQLIVPAWQLIQGRPLTAAQSATGTFTRTLGGMSSTISKLVNLGDDLRRGDVIVDWKGDRVYYTTDPALIKLRKLAYHIADIAEPIPTSTYKRMLQKDIDAWEALIAATAGVRQTVGEHEKEKMELWHQFYELRNQRSELSKVIRQNRADQDDLDDYNEIIARVQRHPEIDAELHKYLEGLKLRPLAYYQVRRGRDRALEDAVELAASGNMAAARQRISRFNAANPGATVTMKSVISRLQARRRRERMSPEQKYYQSVPRDIRRAVPQK